MAPPTSYTECQLYFAFVTVKMGQKLKPSGYHLVCYVKTWNKNQTNIHTFKMTLKEPNIFLTALLFQYHQLKIKLL